MKEKYSLFKPFLTLYIVCKKNKVDVFRLVFVHSKLNKTKTKPFKPSMVIAWIIGLKIKIVLYIGTSTN